MQRYDGVTDMHNLKHCACCDGRQLSCGGSTWIAVANQPHLQRLPPAEGPRSQRQLPRPPCDP